MLRGKTTRFATPRKGKAFARLRATQNLWFVAKPKVLRRVANALHLQHCYAGKTLPNGI